MKIPVHRIKKHLDNMDPWNETNGRTWYYDAAGIVDTLAVKYNKSRETVAGIIAVLSPGCKWEQNLIDAEEVLKFADTATVTTYSANLLKAVRILNGTPFHEVMSNKRTGRKVRAFYHNILTPATSDRVTVDRWIIRAIFGDTTRQLERAVFETNLYERIAAVIAREAFKRNVQPHQLQAALWLQVREV